MHEQENESHRDNGDDRKRSEVAPLGSVLPQEVKDTGGYGALGLILDERHTVGQVAPGVQEREYRANNDAGNSDWYKDTQGSKPRAAGN